MKLTKEEKVAVIRWLKDVKGDNATAICSCPFVNLYYDSDRCMATCGRMFRKVRDNLLDKKARTIRCPCYTYSVKYVKKQARKWVKLNRRIS